MRLPILSILVIVFIGGLLFSGVPALAVFFGRKAVFAPIAYLLISLVMSKFFVLNIAFPRLFPIIMFLYFVFIIIPAYITGYIAEVEQAYLERSEILSKELSLANERKRQFLAYASHELKTPLSGMLGYTSCLLDGFAGALNKEQEEYTQIIATSIKYLNMLIQDFLDLTAIDAGKFELQLEPISIGQCIKEVEPIIFPICREKQLQFKVDLQKDLPLINGDFVRIKQVLINILGNAVKFTEKGEVSFSGFVKGTDLSICISDTGAGIPESMIPQIFEEYKHWAVPASRKYGGSGLGLAIAKKIIEMHGGTISLESSLGKGSSFTILLPVFQDNDANY